MNNDNTGNVNKSSFGIIPTQDCRWVYENTSFTTVRLWGLCWDVDPFGNKLVILPTPNMSESAFKRARKDLQDSGMFEFVAKKSLSDSRKTECWLIRNLKGSKSHLYNPITQEKIQGQVKPSNYDEKIEGHTKPLEGQVKPCILNEGFIEPLEGFTENYKGHTKPLEGQVKPSISPETLTQQEFHNSSLLLFNNVIQEKEIKEELNTNYINNAEVEANNLTEEFFDIDEAEKERIFEEQKKAERVFMEIYMRATEEWQSPIDGAIYLISPEQKALVEDALSTVEQDLEGYKKNGMTLERLTEYRFTSVLHGDWVVRNDELFQVEKNVKLFMGQ